MGEILKVIDSFEVKATGGMAILVLISLFYFFASAFLSIVKGMIGK